MDKKRYVNVRVLIFLYAYSHQAALSLHRSNNATWNEVKDFYNSRIMPERVRGYLSSLFPGLNPPTVNYIKDTFVYTNRERLAYWFLRIPFTGHYLLEEELVYYMQLLGALQGLLTEEIVDLHEVADLGTEFSLFIHRHFQWRLRIKDQHRAMHVAHFFQNERLITSPLDQFMTGLNF